MDSVIGSQGGKVLLTIYFRTSSLMLAFLRDANTARSVSEIFEHLYEVLGHEPFTNFHWQSNLIKRIEEELMFFIVIPNVLIKKEVVKLPMK